MTESTGPSQGDSTRELANAWNLASQPAASHSRATRDEAADNPPPAGTTGFAPGGGATGSFDPGSEIPTRFPRTGETLAGFRIVSELGRGAFARVYLAEQADLADRPVALKVSQALGEEPQVLARLQHAHIVPIHSVHDDPDSRLRLLCMPYLGGANLAEVLEMAGNRLPSQATGWSLVDALDQIGHRMSRADIPGGVRPSSGRASTLDRFQPRRGLGTAGTRGIGSPSRVRALWGRYWARMPWWDRFEPGPIPNGEDGPEPGRAPGDELELAQPSRRFLRSASYIQAAVWIVARLAEGLDHAHSRGLLHRDLKPSNILIAADGTPMLLDFDLSAETSGPDPDDGARARLGGTLPYMAPEHLDAFNPLGKTPADAVDEGSDLYALGLILFEMVAGRHPFSNPPDLHPLTDVLAMMTEERRRGAPSLRAIHPEVPWSLDAILRKCLDPNPDHRHARAGDLAEDLRRFLDDRPLKHTPEPSLRERAAKWARRNPRATSSTSVALLASVLILGLGILLGLLAENLQGASARLQRSTFRTTFDECQLLLNVTSGPPEHLKGGIARAQQALDRYGVGQPGDWTAGPLVVRLPKAERLALREEVAELIFLIARARVFLAERVGDESGRLRALEWGLAWLNRAEAFDPHPTAALYGDRARYRAALGRSGEAARDRSLQVKTAPSTSRDFYLLGTSALAHRRPEEAEAHLLRAVALDPRRFWAWFTLGLCHADQGRFLEAAGDFSVCTALVPDFAWPHLNRGLALARAGRLADARSAYDRALVASPRFAEALVNRALTCLELGDPGQADRDLALALTLGRRDPSLRAARAEAKARLGRRDEARDDFAELLRDHPDDPSLLVARGVFRLADPSTRPAAEADFRGALALDPKHARAHLGLAYLLRRKDPRVALGHAGQALEAEPNLTDALQLRALLRADLGDPAALADVDRVLQAPSPRGLYNAACALSILSRTRPDSRYVPRALDVLRRALDAGYPSKPLDDDPDFDPLRDRDEFQGMLRAAKHETTYADPPRTKSRAPGRIGDRPAA